MFIDRKNANKSAFEMYQTNTNHGLADLFGKTFNSQAKENSSSVSKVKVPKILAPINKNYASMTNDDSTRQESNQMKEIKSLEHNTFKRSLFNNSNNTSHVQMNQANLKQRLGGMPSNQISKPSILNYSIH